MDTEMQRHLKSERLLTERETAQFLNVSRSYLAQSRCYGSRTGQTPGPPYFKLGNAVRYRADDLLAWLEQQRREPRPAA